MNFDMLDLKCKENLHAKEKDQLGNPVRCSDSDTIWYCDSKEW